MFRGNYARLCQRVEFPAEFARDLRSNMWPRHVGLSHADDVSFVFIQFPVWASWIDRDLVRLELPALWIRSKSQFSYSQSTWFTFSSVPLIFLPMIFFNRPTSQCNVAIFRFFGVVCVGACAGVCQVTWLRTFGGGAKAWRLMLTVVRCPDLLHVPINQRLLHQKAARYSYYIQAKIKEELSYYLPKIAL